MIMNKGKWFLKCALAGLVFVLVLGAVVMLLWNWLVPDIFSGPRISYVQAFGLLVLSRILFGGWRNGRRGYNPREEWKRRWHKKLASMSEADRERFKSRLREKWRCGPASPDDAGAPCGSNV